MKPFHKLAIDIPAQVALLKQRGLNIQNDESACRLLEVVGFFRLIPYMRALQRTGPADHVFRPGVSVHALTQLYEFDRKLRLLVIDALERVEVAARSAISHHMGLRYGTHWYLHKPLFRREYRHGALLDGIGRRQEEARRDHERECRRIDASQASASRKAQLKSRRARESYTRHYTLTYSDPNLMPGWAVLEEISLGELSHLFKGLARDADRKAIAQRLFLPGPLLQSWLHSLTVVRNICAHHARLWNREFGICPEQPRKIDFAWPQYLRKPGPHGRLFTILCILELLVCRVSPQSRWGRRLYELLEDFPQINPNAMGFPVHWQLDPFWRRSAEPPCANATSPIDTPPACHPMPV